MGRVVSCSVIMTDASLLRWERCVWATRIEGFGQQRKAQHVSLRSDNRTMVAYIQSQEGHGLSFLNLARYLFVQSCSHFLPLRATYLSVSNNVGAELLSGGNK